MGARPLPFWLQLLLCYLIVLGHRKRRVQKIYTKIDNLQIIDLVCPCDPVQLSSEGTKNILGKSVQNVFNDTDNLQIIKILLEMATVQFSSEATKNVLDKKKKEVEKIVVSHRLIAYAENSPKKEAA